MRFTLARRPLSGENHVTPFTVAKIRERTHQVIVRCGCWLRGHTAAYRMFCVRKAVARPSGFEPLTYGSGGRRSIQLS